MRGGDDGDDGDGDGDGDGDVRGVRGELFLSYFKKTGLQYKAGGVASGFAHVDRDSYPTRLLHCKGKRTVRCHEVAVSSASLNTGDVFILDVGLTLFVWNGYTSHDARLVFV